MQRCISSHNWLCELTGRIVIELQICFIDLSRAYNSVDMPLAWELPTFLGVPPRMLQLIKDLHDDTACATQAEDKQSNWFQVFTGFKQGDVNAPMFFDIFLDSIYANILSPKLASWALN